MARLMDRFRIYFARRAAGCAEIYDKNGDVIYIKDWDEIEHWYEYDQKGRLIHARNSIGFESPKDADENSAD